jgi:hypothetical protein
VHLARIHLDQLTELLRLLPFLIALVLFLTGQGRRGKRRTAAPPDRRMSAPMPPTSQQPALSGAEREEPSVWAKDYDKEDRWGLPKEEWGDAFGEKWKSAFDDPAPPKKR